MREVISDDPVQNTEIYLVPLPVCEVFYLTMVSAALCSVGAR